MHMPTHERAPCPIVEHDVSRLVIDGFDPHRSRAGVGRSLRACTGTSLQQNKLLHPIRQHNAKLPVLDDELLALVRFAEFRARVTLRAEQVALGEEIGRDCAMRTPPLCRIGPRRKRRRRTEAKQAFTAD